ncbi:MAG: helix-turn-helix transcriptional regulator [Oscillospiraceae bacterium]|nr:helix-turn-helix transcriptional regulator [Oscillospiraceae bacterium]
MAKYSKATLINTLRERTGLERAAMHKYSKLDERSLYRIEGEGQSPRQSAFESLVEATEIPMEGFVYPLLDALPMADILRCDRLNQALDIGDSALAETIIAEFEANPAFEEGVQRQFLLSKKARLLEQKGAPAEGILRLIDSAIAETFESFDESAIGKAVLILEEPELLHTKARIYAKAGDLNTAIRMLSLMKSSLIELPATDREKEQQLAPVLLTLSGCLIETGDYEKALEACGIGAEYSATRKNGELNPDFELNTAHALRGLNRMDECRKHLQHAYFGYALLGEMTKANNALKAAREFGVSFNLYGVGELQMPVHPRAPYNRGEAVECDSIGTMVKALRERASLSLAQLSSGICDKSTLQRLEAGKGETNYFTLEAIMQRLGRDVNLYQSFFLSKSDFTALQLRDRINILIINRRFDDAIALLIELEKMNGLKKQNVIKQFVEFSKAQIFAASYSSPQPEYRDMLLDALKVTYPQFDERNIGKHPLTYFEAAILNLYAGFCGHNGEPIRAVDMYERLLRTIKEQYKDEVELSRMYPAILVNYSSNLGRPEQRVKALAIVEEGLVFLRTYGSVRKLPGILFNKGYNEIRLDREDGTIQSIALSYYGASMFSQHGMLREKQIIGDVAKDSLGVDFD